MTTQPPNPRIYVACLSAYNTGKLYGKWIDAAQDADTIRAEIAAMLAASPETGAEEYAIHDYEGFAPAKLGESEDLDIVANLASAIVEYGELFGAVYMHAASLVEAIEMMTDRYEGAWDSLEAWAENWLEDTGSLEKIPDDLRRYFDFGAYARDCEIGGDVFTIDHDYQTHVFRSN